MADRIVYCSKFKEDLKSLDKPPFGGALGEKIYNSVSERAWRLWSEDMMIKVINEYRLNLADPQDYEKLLAQMSLFLGLTEGDGNLLRVGDPEKAKQV